MPPPQRYDLQPPLEGPQVSTLLREAELLHLLHHRNKNQHRRSKWYGWLSTLQRHLRKLITEAQRSLDPKAWKDSSEKAAAVACVHDRLGFLRASVIPNCYAAFATVVGDTQFCPLGLALMGILARVAGVVGFESMEEEEEEEAVKEEVVVEEEEEMGVLVDRSAYGIVEDDEEDEGAGTNLEDERPLAFSLSVRSEPVASTQPDTTRISPSSLPEPLRQADQPMKRKLDEEQEGKKKKKKKRKTGADMIDDIFSGLF